MTSAAPHETRKPGLVDACIVAAGLAERVAVAETPDLGDTEALPPDESALVEGAHPRVRAAFAAGRRCAHAALAKLGAPEEPILRLGGDGAHARAPRWPVGYVGSISHTASYCAAIAAVQGDFAAVGLDVEAASRVTPELLGRVCTPRERARLEAAGGAWPAALHFAAKEAFYKAWSPVMQRPLGFLDAEVAATGADAFTIELVEAVDAGAFGRGPFAGRFALRGDLIAAIVVFPAR